MSFVGKDRGDGNICEGGGGGGFMVKNREHQEKVRMIARQGKHEKEKT